MLSRQARDPVNHRSDAGRVHLARHPQVGAEVKRANKDTVERFGQNRVKHRLAQVRLNLRDPYGLACRGYVICSVYSAVACHPMSHRQSSGARGRETQRVEQSANLADVADAGEHDPDGARVEQATDIATVDGVESDQGRETAGTCVAQLVRSLRSVDGGVLEVQNHEVDAGLGGDVEDFQAWELHKRPCLPLRGNSGTKALGIRRSHGLSVLYCETPARNARWELSVIDIRRPMKVAWDELTPERVRPGVERVGFGTPEVTLVMNTLRLGMELRPHMHEDFDQIALVLSGSMRFVLGGEEVDVAAGEVLHIPAGVMHGGVPTSQEPVRNLDVFAPPRADYAHLLEWMQARGTRG